MPTARRRHPVIERLIALLGYAQEQAAEQIKRRVGKIRAAPCKPLIMTTRARGRPPHPDVLTPAEWAVAEAVRHGLTNPQTAKRQGVSLDAVKYHVANALQKLGFDSRAELRSWNGVRRDSSLYSMESDPMQNPNLGPIGQIARSVKDIAAARRWYGDVLGLPHLYSFGDMALSVPNGG